MDDGNETLESTKNQMEEKMKKESIKRREPDFDDCGFLGIMIPGIIMLVIIFVAYMLDAKCVLKIVGVVFALYVPAFIIVWNILYSGA